MRNLPALRLSLVLGLVASLAPPFLYAQTADEPTLITVSGNGLVELPADYAALVLGVQIEAEAPDSAAARMTRILDQVTDTLVSLGIPRDSLPTSRLSVSPRSSNVSGQRVMRYSAESLVRLRVWDLDRVGEILSVAISAGATNINRLDYRSTAEREGRDEALHLAVEEANREATILAQAQGMELTRLHSMNVGRSSVGFDSNLVGLSPLVVSATRAPATTFVIPARIVPVGVSISVQVTVEWEAR